MKRPARLIPVALVLAAPSARACAVCFGAPGSDVNNAMAMAIFFMLLVLAGVLGAFITFFFYLKRKATPEP